MPLDHKGGGQESVDSATQTITTLINSCVRSVGVKVLQRWARGEAIGVVTLAVVASDPHVGDPRYWSLEAGHEDSSLFR